MSLAIEIDNVTEVLLADGWHIVADESFVLDSYEYLWEEGGTEEEGAKIEHAGGDSGICATGFYFLEKITKKKTYGPLTSILAVRTK